MKARNLFVVFVLLIGLVAILGGSSRAEGPEPTSAGDIQAALSTAFTYQGQLKQGGTPVNGACDCAFRLYDAASAGSQVGSAITTTIAVTSGLFTAQLDFGSGVFAGQARWLDIAVRCPAGSGDYTALSPRQALTAAPYALYAASAPWSGLTGVPAGFADGVDNDTTYTAGAGLVLTGTVFSVNFAGAGSAATVARSDHNHDASYWRLSGNSATTPGTNFLGTTDNQALELKVNSARALRLEPNATSPNVVGGHSGNSVNSPRYGGTIGGGGESSSPNQVTQNFGTVAGGRGNRAAGEFATLGGGTDNIVTGTHGTVGGGYNNKVDGWASTVGGGSSNTVTRGASTIGGGSDNVVSNTYATIAGGSFNIASGTYATVGGGYTNTASGYIATVGGGDYNTASGNYATVGGGYYNTASGYIATVGGGDYNTASGTEATVGGGYYNTASGYAATVGGGWSNTASGNYATVGGGYYNTASGSYAIVGGGYGNTALGDYSFAAGRRAEANHQGAFVWGDSTWSAIASPITNSFVVRASGGIWFGTTSSPSIPAGRFINTSTGGYLSTGGVWADASSRAYKEDIAPLTTGQALEALAGLDPVTFRYEAEGEEMYVGFIAEDVPELVATADRKGLSSMDIVAVLTKVVQEQQRDLGEQSAQIAALEARLAALEALVAKMAQGQEKGAGQ